MPSQLYDWLPPEGEKLVLVLFLSFLIGLEREEHKTAGSEYFAFGGVRTFPLIGLIGYGVALLSGDQMLPLALGFLVVGGFLLMSYWHKMSAGGTAGVTTEMSGLTTYLVGALVFHGHFWIATTLCVAGVFLLQLKAGLEALTKRIAPDDILTFTKFLLLTAVILPIVPNQGFTQFNLNPFKTWLVVVAVSAVSYGSYVLQRLTQDGGILLSALLGGAYSSTVTTVVLARRSSREPQVHLFTGGIVMACGMMYLRLAILVSLFNRQLMALLGPPFIALAAVAVLSGWLWARRDRTTSALVHQEKDPSNPLELRAALLFALLFLGMLVVTRLAVEYLGKAGVYALAAVMGVADVDPFIIGMTQEAGGFTPVHVAAAAIVIAAASNNVVKGVYAYSLSSPGSRLASLIFLSGLAVLGLTPLLMW
jgi:uncharacterized membrane protein (DUF4010 family)